MKIKYKISSSAIAVILLSVAMQSICKNGIAPEEIINVVIILIGFVCVITYEVNRYRFVKKHFDRVGYKLDEDNRAVMNMLYYCYDNAEAAVGCSRHNFVELRREKSDIYCAEFMRSNMHRGYLYFKVQNGKMQVIKYDGGHENDE